MKNKHLILLLVIQTVVIVLITLWIIPNPRRSRYHSELLREQSPDGSYVLVIEEDKNSLGHSYRDIRAIICENGSDSYGYAASMDISVHVGNNPMNFEVEWGQGEVWLNITGVSSFQCILPLKEATKK